MGQSLQGEHLQSTAVGQRLPLLPCRMTSPSHESVRVRVTQNFQPR